MDDFCVVLERFNRKERNLLVRAALGHGEAPLKLGQAFRGDVAFKLDIRDILDDAWWATDYHLDWLAGALEVYCGDSLPLNCPHGNPETGDPPHRLVEGNPQDVDLLISSGQDLILVEAKAYGTFTDSEMGSKLARIKILYDYYNKILLNRHDIRFHVLLVSPTFPEGLKNLWPSWAFKKDSIPWLELNITPFSSMLSVTRCNDAGVSSASGQFWRVVGQA